MSNTLILEAVVVALIAYAIWRHGKALLEKKRARAAEAKIAQEERYQKSVDAQFKAFDKLELAMNTLSSAVTENTRAVDAVYIRMGEVTEAVKSDDATKLLAGTLKACEAIAAATVELREEVAAFRQLVGADKPANYPEQSAILPPSSEDEERKSAFLAALLSGHSVKQAEQQADDEAEKKTMYSAVSFGPEA